MRSLVLQLAFELHKFPSEIEALESEEFAELLGYIQDRNEEQAEANQAAEQDVKPQGRIPTTMGQ
jgi:hypothetical protein